MIPECVRCKYWSGREYETDIDEGVSIVFGICKNPASPQFKEETLGVDFCEVFEPINPENVSPTPPIILNETTRPRSESSSIGWCPRFGQGHLTRHELLLVHLCFWMKALAPTLLLSNSTPPVMRREASAWIGEGEL